MSADGTLYGTTAYGGTAGEGTVFQLTPPTTPGGAWTETVLYSFVPGSGKGSLPFGNLALGKQGALFGTAFGGGPARACNTSRAAGEVFELAPPTMAGGTWTAASLHAFGSTGDGCQPYSGVVMGRSGVLYGTTLWGGANNSGTVFWLTPPATAGHPWTETVYSLSAGAYPYGGLAIGPSGALFGTTSGGGTGGGGTVFELIP